MVAWCDIEVRLTLTSVPNPPGSCMTFHKWPEPWAPFPTSIEQCWFLYYKCCKDKKRWPKIAAGVVQPQLLLLRQPEKDPTIPPAKEVNWEGGEGAFLVWFPVRSDVECEKESPRGGHDSNQWLRPVLCSSKARWTGKGPFRQDPEILSHLYQVSWTELCPPKKDIPRNINLVENRASVDNQVKMRSLGLNPNPMWPV